MLHSAVIHTAPTCRPFFRSRTQCLPKQAVASLRLAAANCHGRRTPAMQILTPALQSLREAMSLAASGASGAATTGAAPVGATGVAGGDVASRQGNGGAPAAPAQRQFQSLPPPLPSRLAALLPTAPVAPAQRRTPSVPPPLAGAGWGTLASLQRPPHPKAMIMIWRPRLKPSTVVDHITIEFLGSNPVQRQTESSPKNKTHSV
jgi:hypothetical protein